MSARESSGGQGGTVNLDCPPCLRRWGYVRHVGLLRLFTAIVLAAGSASAAFAQPPQPTPPDPSVAQQTPRPPDVSVEQAAPKGPPRVTPPEPPPQTAPTRAAAIEVEEGDKAKTLHPYVPNRAEEILGRVETILQGGVRWHPYFISAYAGGGFTLGVGHTNYVGGYNYIDVRGSYTFSNYKRVEAEFVAPRLFKRRASLSILGGWREATQVGFYGVGNDTSKDDRTNYLFNQPYASGLFTIFPNRGALMLQGGVEWSQWSQEPGKGSFPSVETVYTPATLPGLGAEIPYLHTQGTIGLDWRTSPGYSRRGAYLGATLHDYNDRDNAFGFQMLEYDAIGHLPILRETWVISAHARVQTAEEKNNQQIPFFMLPALGGGSSLRGFASWRFRDRNSLLLQAEWRIMVNRYIDMAFFYDAGKVAGRTADLDLDDLNSDFGFGLRFHGPLATPLRVELAKSREGLVIVFSSQASF
jgi:Omp85 superfamily domain